MTRALSRRLIPVLGVLAALAGVVTFAAPAQSSAAAAPDSPVVVVGTTGLRWDDVDRERTPHLWSLLERGSVADLSIRNVRTAACPVDGWLALSAGRRAGDEGRGGQVPQCRPLGNPAFRGTTAVVDRWAVYVETAEEGTFEAQPGLLGESLRTAGVDVAAIGPGAGSPCPGRTAGRRPVLRPSARPHRPRRDDQHGARVERAGRDRPGQHPDPEDLSENDPDRAYGDRADQVDRLDELLGVVLDEVPDSSSLLVASLADSGATPHLQLVAAGGPTPSGAASDEYGPALLGSRSTRQDGLTQATDLMPTVLELVGADVPTGLPGATVLPVADTEASANARFRTLIDLSEAALAVQPLVVWFFNGLVIAQILLYGGAALALKNNWGGIDGRRRVLGILRRIAVVFAAVPVSTFLANLVPWWRSEFDLAAVVGSVLVAVAVVSTVALLGPWRDRRLGPMGFVAGITSGVLALDVATGSTLQISSLMGQQPVVAGRFYGLGNVQFALFATGALLLACALADAALKRGRRRLAVGAVAAIGLVATVIDGTPGIGSDFGGPPAMIPAFTLLTLLVAGVRITWRKILLIGAGTAVAVVMLSVADWLRPASDRTHFGRFVQSVIDGGAMPVIERKALQNWEILTGSWLTVLVPFGAVFIGLVLMRPVAWGAPALQRTYEAAPTLRHALVALLVMLGIGFAVNDSGTVVPAIGATLAIPLLIAASVRTLELADAEEGGPGATAEAPPPEQPVPPTREATATRRLRDAGPHRDSVRGRRCFGGVLQHGVRADRGDRGHALRARRSHASSGSAGLTASPSSGSDR